MAARSEQKANQAIADIKWAMPDSKEALLFLSLDIAYLISIKNSVK